MVDKILDYFITLTKIPHCSKESEKLFRFLIDFGKKRDYEVKVDRAKNILISSKSPKITFQAHYDMVCIKDAPNIKVIREKNWLKAENSSLGADNGVAIAMMMVLMDMGVDGEFLFTADEEIGLIGASNIELKLNSNRVLNLDFEEEGRVCIGCAGGADIKISKRLKEAKALNHLYKIKIEGLAGGHSGIDIDKNIPNAIKLLIEFLKDKDISLIDIRGGERINSIPTEAIAVVSSLNKLTSNGKVKVEKLNSNAIEEKKFYNPKELILALDRFKNGVIEFNKKLNVPHKSINLALIGLEGDTIEVQLSARAMDEKGLDEVCSSSVELFNSYGFESQIEDKYPSWKPEVTNFAKEIRDKMEDIFKNPQYVAIHAGLECGVLSKKYPNLQICSIGPTILSPHSIYERVDINSIEKTFNLILKLL